MKARRTDANHRALLDLAQQLGAKVFDTHCLPNFVDAVVLNPRSRLELVSDQPRWVWLPQLELWELKAPKGKLRASQQKLIDAGWPIRVIKTREDVLNALGVRE
jgi:hypothetical protein